MGKDRLGLEPAGLEGGVESDPVAARTPWTHLDERGSGSVPGVIRELWRTAALRWVRGAVRWCRRLYARPPTAASN